jgi:hypothetical protein
LLRSFYWCRSSEEVQVKDAAKQVVLEC